MKQLSSSSVLIISMLTVGYVQSANFLVLTFFSSKSHKLTYLPLIEELGRRGHNITFVSPIKPTKEAKNVHEIYTFDAEKLRQETSLDGFEKTKKQVTVHPTVLTQLALDTCNKTYDLPQVKALLHGKFDLAFVQPTFNECILGLVHRLQIPYVLFTFISVPAYFADKVGNSFPFSLTPNVLLAYPLEMTFYERFKNFGMEIIVYAMMGFYYEPKVEALYREKLGDDIPSISEIFANASLILSNGHFSLAGPRQYYPDIVDIGGIHSRPAKPIPKNLEDFIREGSDGFILFSMGSVIRGENMPEDKRKMILNVFSRLKQQVIWKWESETMPDLPKNVKLVKWLPQQDLLGHKDIKLFITHCGGGSTEEAVYHGVPLIGIPVRADQPYHAASAQRHGFLVQLDWIDLTEQDFEAAIKEVLNNPTKEILTGYLNSYGCRYRNNVKRLSTLFKDRPQEPMETAVYWIEYVLRHQGAPHLRNIGRKLNFIQYHSIDVIATYVAIITTAMYLAMKVLTFVCRKCNFVLRKVHSSKENGKKTN